VDQFERVARLKVFLWSIVGAFLGFLLGVFLGVQGKAGPLVVMTTTLIGWASSYFGPLLLMKWSAQAGGSLYNPSGKSTPRKREYSLAESYVARGEYQAAIDAFEVAIGEDPTDSMPYIRVARIQRDKVGDPEGAAHWFKRALTESETNSGMRTLLRKELLELYEVRMKQPERAAPMLARISEQEAGTADGDWAGVELGRIKAIMADGSETL
jgi:tetratricopeptide (TPR) repeat protein